MARLDYIHYDFYEASLSENGELVWTKQTDKAPIERLPQIYWENHSGWDEVNAWALDRAASGTVDDETVRRTMKHLCRYADFTETEQLDWRHFPVRREHQVLRKFRKHLIEQRDEGTLASSTASNCMSTVIQFYRFADLHNLIGNSAPMWKDRLAVMPYHDTAGFKRTAVRLSSDLSIPNRNPIGLTLEDGLLPLHADHMNQLVAHTAKHETEELHLMLSTGFFTGGRVGSLRYVVIGCLTLEWSQSSRGNRNRSRRHASQKRIHDLSLYQVQEDDSRQAKCRSGVQRGVHGLQKPRLGQRRCLSDSD
ncbi:hypothetical protein [Paraburkholderia azotifigens]|uniref:hypothetical protein n=1 Tax=Paraburkholderia azotifigens TaxID=2057004 RepID=UPI001F022D89|nr:hypothetical protein [Paraburkholderia azotifigens]